MGILSAGSGGLRRLVEVVVFTVLYAAVGVASDLLAVPPYYAAAFWLPSGIALIATLRLGIWGAVSAVMGSSLAHAVHVISSFGWMSYLTDPFLSLLMGLGGGVEAGVGAWLLRRGGCWPEPTQQIWRLMRSIVVSVSLAGLCSALIGPSIMMINGTITPALWLGTAVTWWTGDVVGMLLVLPLLYFPWRQGREEFRHFAMQLLLPLILMALAALLFFTVLVRHNHEQLRATMTRETNHLFNELQEAVGMASRRMEAMRAFFEASDYVEPTEFSAYARHLLQLSSNNFAGYLWAPWLESEAELDALRLRLQTQGAAPLVLHDGTDRARTNFRPPYVPIVYSEPPPTNSSTVLGMEVWSGDGTRWPVFGQAIKTGKTAFSAAVPAGFMQGKQPAGVVLATPVGLQAPFKSQRGFVISFISLQSLTEELLELAADSGLVWTLHDLSAGPSAAPLIQSPGVSQAVHMHDPLPANNYSLDVGGREWRLTVEPTAEFLRRSRSLNLWAGQLGSVLFVSLGGLFLLSQWLQNGALRRMSRQLSERNAELHELSAQLETRVRDRTEEANVQSEKSAAAEKRLREITDNLPGVVFQVMRTGTQPSGIRVGFLSGGISRMTGHESNELTQLIRMLVEEDMPGLMTALADRSAIAEGYWAASFRIRRKDGEIRWTRIQAYLADQQGDLRVWNGFWTDITESKKLEAELRHAKETADRANRAKSDFLAMMSHEIRTPMNSALGLLELAQIAEMEPGQRAMLEAAHDASRTLLRLIDDLLDFSRIEAGRLELSEAPASVSELVDRIAGLHGENISAKGLSFEARVDAAVGVAHRFDRMRLRQILNNLLSNALKFTQQGQVSLQVDVLASNDQRQQLRFRVTDTGIGISPEQLQRIFQPFVQAHAETWQRYGGSGLGLSISRRLAELMGGQIQIDSVVGEGTVVTLTVELARASLAELAAVQKQAGPQRLSALRRRLYEAPPAPSMTLLAADDHAPTRLLLAWQFRALGLGVEVAPDGLEALALWRRLRPALLLTDCNMPGMDGHELARLIRQEEASLPSGSPRTIIIGCSADVAMKGPDMNEILVKPLGLEALESCLARHLPSLSLLHHQASEAKTAGGVDDRARAFEYLTELSGGDAELARELVGDFAVGLRNDVTALREALAANERELVARAAHRLKGGFRAVGAIELSAAMDHMETDARAGRLTEVAASFQLYESRFLKLQEALSRG